MEINVLFYFILWYTKILSFVIMHLLIEIALIKEYKMNGGIDPEPSGICNWCGDRYELGGSYRGITARDGFCGECVGEGCRRLDRSIRIENLTWFGRLFVRFIFKV